MFGLKPDRGQRMIPFERVIESRLVLFDGAMGTYIYQQGVFIDKCYDELNLANPDLIRKIHREYLNAGAIVLETNTFGANRIKLERHNLGTQVEAINREGVFLAKEIASDRAYVAGSIGPLGVPIEPLGNVPLSMVREVFTEQAKALVNAGVDLLILETFHDIREIEEAVHAVRAFSKIPMISLMTVQEDGKTRYGVDVEEIAEGLSKLPVTAVGLNCAIGPKPMLEFLERMLKVTDKPMVVMPNAGRPQCIDDRMFYMSTPDYFGVYAKRFIETGARIIGGCCGTTPDHIKKMAESVVQKQTRTVSRIETREAVKVECKPLPPIPQEEKSDLAAKIMKGRFVLLVEMVPPRGRDIAKQLESATRLKQFGADAINIPDGPRASARMTGLALAVMLQTKVKIEAVLHYACRDHSLIGMQSSLLGASVLGIRNILAITGDPPMLGDYPQSTAVFDIDSIGLTRIINNLNQGLDLGNKLIGAVTGFFVGVGVDPNAINPERELQRYFQKVEAGAEFVITQPVFDLSALEKFLNQTAKKKIPFIAGIWPLMSYQNAEFMRNEVPGVTVPDAVLTRIGQFESKEDQRKIGIEIAQEMVHQVRGLVQGVQISAPFGRVDVAIEVAQAAH
jgi:methionine synthase I (cobalamin-dependent)/5,10-methylenetetrahydrofolate reductase